MTGAMHGRSLGPMPSLDTSPSHAPRAPRVAIVDIDRRIQTALADVLRVHGLDVVGATGDTRSALALVQQGVEVLILDPRLPDLATGSGLVRSVTRDWPKVRIVIMGWGDSGDSAMARHAAGFISKSAPPEQFVAAALAAIGT
jgi:DNA-binding NarL/FixJ family response regulator